MRVRQAARLTPGTRMARHRYSARWRGATQKPRDCCASTGRRSDAAREEVWGTGRPSVSAFIRTECDRVGTYPQTQIAHHSVVEHVSRFLPDGGLALAVFYGLQQLNAFEYQT